MSDLIDYVSWRGDLPIEKSPFNEVDALILSQLSYLDYSGIVAPCFLPQVTIADVLRQFKTSVDYKRRSHAGLFINPKTVDLLESCGKSVRFKNMAVCGFINKIDLQREEQFSVVTVLPGDKTAFIAFRGTDDTIVGWKEDFNMSFTDVIPSQTDAVDYMASLCGKNGIPSKLYKKIRIAGHSKGGNLAIYATSFSTEKIKNKISDIYTFDAPGLNEYLVKHSDFSRIKPFLHSFYPQFSIIGMLFNHPENFTVVESGQDGIMQHDPFSWHVTGPRFVTLPDFENLGKYVQKTLNAWFFGLSVEKREMFVETMFKVLQATEARTNTELSKNWFKNSAAVIKALASLDSESRKETLHVIHLLFKTAAVEMPALQ